MAVGYKRHWATLIYYYLVALVSLSFVIAGTIGAGYNLIQAAFPQLSPDVRYWDQSLGYNSGWVRPAPGPPGDRAELTLRDQQSRTTLITTRKATTDRLRDEGFYKALQFAVFAVVGFPVFFWHIRRARRHEFPTEYLGPPGDFTS